MSSILNVLGISGSLRKASKNSALLRTAQGLVPEEMTLDIFDISDIPLYNQDVEDDGFPPSVERLAEALEKADALLIACPEDNWSITPPLKNAIDWASRKKPSPLDDMPVAIMGVGGGAGAGRAQQHLRQVFVFTNSHVMNKPEVAVRLRETNFDDDGRPTDQHVLDNVSSLLVNLDAWTRRLQVFVKEYEDYPQGY